MTDSSTYPADNAFRNLRQTLEDLSNELKSWAKSFLAHTAEERMASSISAQFDLEKDFTSSTLLNHTNFLKPEALSSVERYITRSFKELNIHSMETVAQMSPLIEWIGLVFGNELDFEYLGIPPSELHKYAQKSRQIRNGVVDLSHMLTKEQHDFELNQQLSDTLSKLSAVGLDIDKLESLQRQSEEQAKMFKDWIERADKKIRDFHNTEQNIVKLAADSKLASDNYSAAQSRLDSVSEETAERKLVEHFQAFGQKHNLATWGFFAVGIVILVGAAGYSIQFAQSAISSEPPINSIPWRFAIVAANTAIGTYLLRLASYHRRLSVWADTVQVQLQTFASYTNQIGDETSKNQLRAEFAKRVFGDEPGRPGTGNDKGSESLSITELSTLIANISRLQSKP